MLPEIARLVKQRASAGSTSCDTYHAVQDLGRDIARTAHPAVPLSRLMSDSRVFPTRKAVYELFHSQRQRLPGQLSAPARTRFDDLSELAIIGEQNPSFMLHVPIGAVTSAGKTYNIPHVTILSTRAMQAFAG